MQFRYRTKPSKSISIFSMMIGLMLICFGIFIIAMAGPNFFVLIWLVVTVIFTIYNAINAFTKKGVDPYNQFEIIDDQSNLNLSDFDFDKKLRQLHQLKEDNIISEQEFQSKKKELLNKKW